MLIETTQHGRVFHIALNRPEKRNALNSALCRELLGALETDSSVGAIVLSGNGPSFCAGMDLKEQADAELHEQLFTLISRLRKPLIAAVQGPALGGGTGVVANAHIAIASNDAKFGLTEIKIGLWPVLIFRAVALAMGERRATELSLTGRTFNADEAQSYGLVTEIAENPVQRALEIAALIANHSATAIGVGLEHANQIRGLNWSQAGSIGRTMREQLLASDEFQSGVRRFFQ